MTTQSKLPTSSRASPSSVSFAGLLYFTIPSSPFTISSVPTTCGDIQQKNRQPIFSEVETLMKMTFHSFEQNPSQTREPREPLSKTPLLFFHYENVFRKNRRDKSRQTQSHLTPMITSPISPENQIAKEPVAASARVSDFIWSLVLGHLVIPNTRPKSTLIGRKST
jgi:hypothetical protein